MSKKKQQNEQAPRKRRIAPRQLMTSWIIGALAATSAWYALAAIPDGKAIQQLENDVSRAETRLNDNRQRLNELEAEIVELEVQAAVLDKEYAAFNDYLGELDAIGKYGENLAAALVAAGLEVTQAEVPAAWTTIVGPYRTAQFTIDATGTYAAITSALDELEAQPGISLRELQIVKNGGDPDDPTLITRLTLRAQVKAN